MSQDETPGADDRYQFPPTLGEMDLYLFGEGRHHRLWEKLGAHLRTIEGVRGASFAVWAPNATSVSVIGSFNDWDGARHVMRRLGSGGVHELFVPGVEEGALYKYEIVTQSGRKRIKTDPYAAMMEGPPGHASIVRAPSAHAWGDGRWLARRADADPTREPMLVYETHLASWRRGADGRVLSYRELAPMLAEHVSRLGFTHVELLPVQEHPFGGSWGYQIGGYFAPASQHGTPDDFRAFVDTLHQAGIGVLLDWVPAHFPRDDWALRRFDGTACYEHEDPRLGDHPEWGTHIFNYGRHEVRNFLLANALYWIEEFHIDGLRVDAVASMLYLDYGRQNGEWLRNRFGGRENLEAVSFLKQLNYTVHSLHPGVVMVAEESTTWPRVTHAIADGGLGFTFKWNMGWMHDTLDYYRVDPFFRRGAHDKLTFGMMYEYSERFVNPLSHDEVVHLKRSLLEKMPGDLWQRFANLRTLIAYSITRPGKSLFFMGTELAPHEEWNHDVSLPWHLAAEPRRAGMDALFVALGALYREQSCFWRLDHHPAGYAWVDVGDKEQSVLSYARFDGAQHAVVILNLTPVPRPGYRIGAPMAGTYRVALNSDDTRFGGSGFSNELVVQTEPTPYHGFPQSMTLSLPPLGALILLPDPMPPREGAPVVEEERVTPSEFAAPARPRRTVTTRRVKRDPDGIPRARRADAPEPSAEPRAEKKSRKVEKASKVEKAVNVEKAAKVEKATKESPKRTKAPKQGSGDAKVALPRPPKPRTRRPPPPPAASPPAASPPEAPPPAAPASPESPADGEES